MLRVSGTLSRRFALGITRRTTAARPCSRDCSTSASSDSTSSGPTDEQLRTRILDAALAEVPTLGWTTDALMAGAAAQLLSPMAHGLLPRGPIELVEHFSASCDAQLANEMRERAAELEGLEVHNRLIVAMQTRLRIIAPYSSSWPQALALRALPQNLTRTLHDAHGLAAILMDACGEDVKTPLVPSIIDPHMKMLSIGAIYGAAELHLLTDTSPDHADTWVFVDREVEALRTMAVAKGSLPDLSPAGIVLSLLARK